ncbi:hypothetical protein BpHYR1_044462 [Brachionus plicatilis]|uniref:Uncharacterized protein n=1 Tax=Brachionus plicatilis TaxID=10195 RepID=A0A3M7P3Y2_BRAPC|nr:hypothetical protein BpHYR1_044462 [Brachionus plicatilis]
MGENRKRGKPVTIKKALMIQPTELQIRDYVRNQNKLPEALVKSILSQVDVMKGIEAQEAEMEIQNEVGNNSNENSAQSEIPKKKRGRPTGSNNKPKSIQDQPQNKRTKKD